MKIFTKIQNLNSWFRTLSRVAFVFVLTVTCYTMIFVFGLFYKFFGKNDIVWSTFPDDMGLLTLFFLGVLFAPIFETWFCQYLPYYFLKKVRFLRERNYLILLLSALFFGINHFYSLFYIVFGFLGGLIFSYGYLVRIKSDKNTFYLIAITHGFVNLGALIHKIVN